MAPDWAIFSNKCQRFETKFLCASIQSHIDAYDRLMVVCSASQLLLLHDSDIIMRVHREMRQKGFSTVKALL